MRLARGMVVAACLLSPGVSAGEDAPRAAPAERGDGGADSPAIPKKLVGDPAPPGPESTAIANSSSRSPGAPLPPATAPPPEAAPAPPTIAGDEAAPAPELASEAPLSTPEDLLYPGPAGRDREAATDVTLDRSSRVWAGLAYGGPIGASASVRLLHGLSADVRDDDTRVKAVCALPIPHCAQGFLVQVDAGSAGGKVSLGVGARAGVVEEDFHGTVGLSLRASLARTWGNPIGTEPGLTYLGPELDLSIMKVDLTLGVLWRVGGRTGASALFSWGVGLGL